MLGNLLTLGRTAVHGVDPMPGADTAAIGTGRHVLGDLEGSVDLPNTLMVDTEDGQILGFDAVHVGGVRDREGTTFQVIMALRVEMNKRFFVGAEVELRLTVAKRKRLWWSSQSAKIGETASRTL